MKTRTIKRTTLMLIILMAWVAADAQVRIDWQQCYGTYHDDHACDIAETPEGLLLLGMVDEDGGGMYDCSHGWFHYDWLINVDGNLNLTGQHCENYGMYQQLHQSSNGMYYITELCNDYMVFQLRITCVNENGGNYWIRRVGSLDGGIGLSWGVTAYGNDISGTPTPDGGIVALTICDTALGEITHHYGGTDCWLVKYNADGTMAWETTLGTSGDEVPMCIVNTADGGLLLGLQSKLSGGGNLNCEPLEPGFNTVLAKLDASGTLLWCHVYSDIIIQQTLEMENGYLLVGNKLNIVNPVDNCGDGINSSDCCLLRCDSEGNVIWKKEYGGNCNDNVVRAFPTSNGELTVFANTKSNDGDVVSAANLGVTETEPNNVWVFHTDAEGTLLWERCIGSDRGLYESVSSVISSSDGGYIMVGEMTWFDGDASGDVCCSNNALLPNSGHNIWLVHLTEELTGTSESTLSKIIAVPNPTNGSVRIDGVDAAQVEVYNSMGQLVKTFHNSNELHLEGLAKGLYQLRITDKNGVVFTDKVLID